MTSPWLYRPKRHQAGLVINSLTKYIGGHGNALGGAVTDTGLYDWTRFPNIYDNYKNAKPAAVGHPADPQEGTARRGQHAGGRARAPHRDRRRDAGAADGALLRDNALRLARFLAAHPQGDEGVLPGARRITRSTASPASSSRRYGALMSFELADGIDCFDFLNRLKLVISSSHLGDNRTLAIPIAQTIYWEMGPERRAEMGIVESLIRLSIGIEDARRPDRRFQAGAGGLTGPVMTGGRCRDRRTVTERDRGAAPIRLADRPRAHRGHQGRPARGFVEIKINKNK